jgi:putative transposase
LIDANHSQISINRQCELLEFPRASYYYTPCPVDELSLELMRRIDEQYLKTPFYGSRRMVVSLQSQGFSVNRKRVQNLMRMMGIEAIYPKRRLSVANKEHKIYPYLLRGLDISRPDQVWATDITYIRLNRGFAYLVAVMDWYSRYVLSWELSLTLETDFCLEALRNALKLGKPEIFNTDQGCQFTSEAFTGILKAEEIMISMDGRGRVFDNIMVERLWRSVKYEEVFLNDYRNVLDSRHGLGKYFGFYNEVRPHQSLGYRTPEEVYFGEQHSEDRRISLIAGVGEPRSGDGAKRTISAPALRHQ